MLGQIAVFLIAAVVVVPVFHRLGFGSVLGYLVAGMAIGPWGLALVTDVEAIVHASELGVVLLLFVIGLELQPSRLWALRKTVFGLGATQVGATTAVIGLLAWIAGAGPLAAFVIGIGLALSSTAFVLQTLAERRELPARHGREAFAVLLFQDIAVIPVLAALPLLAGVDSQAGAWTGALRAGAVLALVVVAARPLLRVLFRAVARIGVREIFTAAALLVVVGLAWLMTRVGLSASLGAFIGGVLLADSEFRHAIEADLEPFKGLLLGLFFIAVGMSVNLGLVATLGWLLPGLALGALLTKGVIVYGAGRLGGDTPGTAARLAIALAAGGEFAFVIFAAGAALGLLDPRTGQTLTLVVTATMMLAPFVFLGADRWRAYWTEHRAEPEFDRIDEPGNPVVIVGFSRFGQIIARVLRMRAIAFTALDASAEQVDFVRGFGSKVYYGDATRAELLRAARVHEAKLVVVAVGDIEKSLAVVDALRRYDPRLPLYARARNRQHCFRLMDRGVQVFQRDTYLSGLAMAGEVLRGLGIDAEEAERSVARFRAHDETLLARQHAVYNDEAALRQSAREAAEELARIFEDDAAQVASPPSG
ncbi:MAG: cation:proton antiporter [Gammaproteobacteria bacterium]|nr:cation:proton antiporter [Gammaproteobacteria bacterium]